MNTAMHKNVKICTLQFISFESALNTLLFPAVLKNETNLCKNILNVHWSVMRGKTIYTKIYIKCPNAFLSVMRGTT